MAEGQAPSAARKLRPWRPSLSGKGRPVYRAIVRALADDIRSGALPPGAQLPTHRELADHLDVTVSTVTRAYKYAQEMGLITGQVGRGSFVAIPGWNSAGWDFPETRLMRTGFRGQSTVDMMLHRPSLGVPRSVIPPALGELSRFHDLRASFDYPTPTGSERHRLAGASWMKLAGLEIDPESIVLCSGAQQALFTAIATNTEPGDVVVVEQVNYIGVRRIADLLRLRLIGVRMKPTGMDLEALETICAVHKPKLLICTPTMHNPTTVTMSLSDRRRLLEIADKHGVLVVEDDVFGPLAGSSVTPLYAMNKDNVLYISSTSKALAPGLRCGYLVVPPREADRYAGPILTCTWGPSPFLADFVSDLIEKGVGAQMVARQLELSAERVQLARSMIGDHYNLRSDLRTFHTWLILPPGLDGEAMSRMLGSRNVMVSPGSLFSVERKPVDAVRLSLGAPASLSKLRVGLENLIKILNRGMSLV